MAASKHVKIKLREVNRHLVCRLCRGYYVDATTIAECLHSFCRSCIIKYLEKNSFCPICEVQIHKTKPYLNLRLDKALQDVVYKVVPGLYHNEMKRRRDFYAERQEQIPFATPEQCGLEERIIFSPEDSISLSLEYLESYDIENETVSSKSSESGDNPDGLSFPQQLGLVKSKNGDGKTSRRESQDVQETSVFSKRYLQCPAIVNIGHLKKFISLKHDLKDKMQVSIIHKRVPLPDHYTLMDVAYIYTWKRSAPLKFFYQIYQLKKHNVKIPPTINEVKESESEVLTDEVKLPEKVEDEKVTTTTDVVKPIEAVDEVKTNPDKVEVMNKSEPNKPSVHNNVLKKVDSNKPVKELTPEPVTKTKPIVNGVAEETESKTDETTPRNNKSEKTKSDGKIPSENKPKVESAKRKNSKVENGAREVKENKSDNDKLLLNPISGQLESNMSTEQCKSSSNRTVLTEKKETIDSCKKEVKHKKSDSENLDKKEKKSNVNLLKNFRKEKQSSGKEKDDTLEIKSNKESSLTITTVKPKPETPIKKDEVEVSIEIKCNSKESEYDFDGSSPPRKIIPLQEFSKYSKYSKFMAEHREKWLSKESKTNKMSLQDFREKILKENESKEDEVFNKNNKKLVPYLHKLNSEVVKSTGKKNDKQSNEKPKETKALPSLININSSKSEGKSEVSLKKTNSPPLPIKIESRNGEYCVKPVKNEKNVSPTQEVKLGKEIRGKDSLTKESLKRCREKLEEDTPKNKISKLNDTKESSGAIDLTKTELSPKSEKSLDNLLTPKGPTKVMDGSGQKQNFELKIPQCSQKNSPESTTGKNISPNEITQALQFLKDLRSDMKVLEGKNPNSVLEQFTQKSANFEPYKQLYQQKIDLIRRLKRHQKIIPKDSDSPPKKHVKLSPTSESPTSQNSPTSEQKTKTSPVLDELNQYKSSLDRSFCQMQLLELQSRLLAAHNYKNIPALLQYYNRPRPFCPDSTSSSKSNQQKIKPSSQSSSKSPQNLNSSGSSPDSSFFNSQSYNHLINAGLTSEMTYHQMFQSYLNQQEQINQVKASRKSKKPIKFSEVSPKSLSDKYYSSETNEKKQELHNSVPSVQKS